MKTLFSILALALVMSCSAVATQFSDDFNTNPIDAGWSNVVGSNYTQSGGVLTAGTAVGVNSISAHSGAVSTIQPFSMTVDFTFDGLTGTENWAGLIAHSGGTGLTGADTLDYLVFRVRGGNGRVTLSTFDNNATQFNLALSHTAVGSSTPSGDLGALTAGNDYRLTLSGDTSGFYVGEVIDLTAGTTLITMTNTTAFTPLVGGEFGLYSRNVGSNDLHYDHFSATDSSGPPMTVPAAPTGLVALSSPGSVALDWDENGEGDLAGYSVYRKEGTGDFVLLATVATPTSAYTDSGLSAGLAYTYQVTARNATGGESAASNQAAGTFTIDLSPSGPKPNIILVMSDDQGWGDTGYNGHGVVLTPSLDAMAADGYVFNRFYAAAPVCSPSRAGVMSGRHPIRCKVPQHGRYMRAQEVTIAEALKEAGYVTGIFGKVHLGSGQPDSPANPSAMGFDEWVIGLNYFDNNPYLSRNGVVEHPTGKGTDITMDETIGFLNTHKDGGKPMFAMSWFPAPHDPHQEIPSGSPLYGGDPNAGYYREITLLDENVGRLRQWLRDNSIHENTILWWCSDNGGLLTASSGGREKKGSVYEGGLRVPAIIEWPARGLKGANNIPIVHTDMYPTLLAMAGVSVNNQLPLDGIDVSPLIDGRADSRGAIGFWHNFQAGQSTYSDNILSDIMAKQLAGAPTPHNAARIKKDIDEFPQFAETTSPGHAAWLDWPWKLHRKSGTTYELYNLEADPMEATNLSGQPAHAQRVNDMTAELLAWQQSVVRSINGADYGQLDTWLPMNRAEGVETFDANGEKRGDLVDFADNTSHWVAGKHNRALEFDGTDDEVVIDNACYDPPVGANARTVSAWIKTAGSGSILSWGDAAIAGGAWELGIDGNGRLHLNVGSGSITGQTDLRDNLWHHIALVLSNDGSPNVTETVLYVDGGAETPGASRRRAIRTSNSEINLSGARTGGTDLCIDELRIVPRALSAADVSAEYTATNQASAAWLYKYFGHVGPADWDSDEDGDGHSLLEEYAFGNNPHVPDRHQGQPAMVYNAGTQKLEYSFTRRRDGTHDLDYTPQFSRDLSDWTLPWVVKSTVAHPSLDSGLFEIQTIESDPTLVGEPRLFVQMGVSLSD